MERTSERPRRPASRVAAAQTVIAGDERLTLVSDDPGPPRPELDPGVLVGRYVIIACLGRGGMGVVYTAYDPELDRKVALKLLRPELHGHGAAPARDLLLREAQAMARLSHPAVVTVHEVGEHRGAVYIAMEFVAGQTLRQWLEAGHRRWRAVVDMFLQAGRGLMAAHEAGLVHRDFKPEKLVARAPSAPLGSLYAPIWPAAAGERSEIDPPAERRRRAGATRERSSLACRDSRAPRIDPTRRRRSRNPAPVRSP
ncbi:MAG: serine/threonine protein kinase [Myxococcales bacterium]|nr:serine/threonine protein kinase [Myxococcales bacterium]